MSRVGQLSHPQFSRQEDRGEGRLLDICFGEDQSRARIGNAAEDLSRVRRIALMLLKQEHSTEVGIKCKRLKAGWDEAYPLQAREDTQ